MGENSEEMEFFLCLLSFLMLKIMQKLKQVKRE